ncbi:MAG: hypothetical protein H7Y27_04690, partial [Gemmatimonadaceae bacterium]|nr:hypothetical protein [Chitinophagaceae bacterium]
LYSILLKNFPSPVVALNRSVAALYAFDGHVALGEIQLITGLENFYLFHAAMGEILTALGRKKDAITAFEHAASLTASEAELQLLREKISGCLE